LNETVDEFTRKFMRNFNKYLLPREKEITNRLNILEAQIKLIMESLSSHQTRFDEIEEQIQALEPLRHLEGFSRFLEKIKVRLDPKQEVVVFDLDKVMKGIEKDLEESESETEDH